MATCTIMVGLPASGKSTRVREMVTMHPDVFVYSTDDLLEVAAKQLGSTYNEVFDTLIKSVTSAANSSLDVAIRYKQDIIWDQTNLGAKKRAKIINRMRNAGYTVNCECFMIPQGDSQWEDWRYRLANRPGKTIPDNVIESMMDSFVMPSKDEGFDEVWFWDIYGNQVEYFS